MYISINTGCRRIPEVEFIMSKIKHGRNVLYIKACGHVRPPPHLDLAASRAGDWVLVACCVPLSGEGWSPPCSLQACRLYVWTGSKSDHNFWFHLHSHILLLPDAMSQLLLHSWCSWKCIITLDHLQIGFFLLILITHNYRLLMVDTDKIHTVK